MSPTKTFMMNAASVTKGGELPFAAECTKVGCADKLAVGAKFLMSGSIPIAAFEAKSKKMPMGDIDLDSRRL